jgi:thiamine biosynthesis lipoprotein
VTPITQAALPPRVLVPRRIDARAPALGAQRHTLRGQTMGTSWRADVLGAPCAGGERWRVVIERELALVIAQMSTWQADSELARFNAAAPGSSHRIAAGFAEVLGCALRVAAASGGAFDPTAGALVDLWGFGPVRRFDAADFTPPDAAALARALGACGWSRLRFDPVSRCLEQPGGLRLDLSAIAKGYAVDRVVGALRATGVESCLVDIGGELRGAGVTADGQPWWVDLERPGEGCALPLTRIALHGLAVATSGDYRRSFVCASGLRRSHTIDPRRGEPVSHGLASVSVLHEQCMWADAWSTALTVLGPAEGLALARQYGLAALFIRRRHDGGFDECATPALRELAA